MRKFLFLFVLASPLAQAGVVIDQSQVGYSPTSPLALGGSSQQSLAQTFEPGFSGTLSHIQFVIACAAGSPGLVSLSVHSVDVDGVPTNFSLGTASIPAIEFADGAVTWRDFYFTGVYLEAGTRYAIVARAAPEAQCSSRQGAVGGSPFAYPNGEAFFEALPNPPGMIALSPTQDFSFYTFMFDGEPNGPNYCQFEDANGIANDWLPSWVPVCGCFTDPILRGNRCWFSFPEFVLWREIPLPIDQSAGGARWTLLPQSSELISVIGREDAPQDSFASAPFRFEGNLTAGTPQRDIVRYRGVTNSTDVHIRFETLDGTGQVRFRTLLNEPDQQ